MGRFLHLETARIGLWSEDPWAVVPITIGVANEQAIACPFNPNPPPSEKARKVTRVRYVAHRLHPGPPPSSVSPVFLALVYLVLVGKNSSGPPLVCLVEVEAPRTAALDLAWLKSKHQWPLLGFTLLA
uniref:Uncharacterized protein n=1 Tax=Zea mays TaxID=4577 RepID=A0A804P8M7_MAIZE